MKRVLITISFSFSIRYLYRTNFLHKLRKICEPVIVITWNQQDLINELKQDGFEIHVVPESNWGNAYTGVRKKIDFFFNRYMLKSPTHEIEQRYLDQFVPFKRKIIRRTREWYNNLKFFLPVYVKKLFLREESLLLSDTNYKKLSQIIETLKIDAVFTVTPFHKQEDILLRVCKHKQKLMITSILSFDNITKRGWIPVNYDVYMVWNKYNATELKRIYPNAMKKNIQVVGAPQFDFYFNPSYILQREKWRQEIGMKNYHKKIILYAGGPSSLVPNELQYVKILADAIKKGIIPSSTVILFRCHPIDNIEKWKDALQDYDNILFQSSWTGTDKLGNANITQSDIISLCSTLAHSDVHISFCSTMIVDGSAFNKPQIAPCFDDINQKREKLLQDLYKQEHFAPVINSNGVVLAKSKEQLIQFVTRALETPEVFSKRSSELLENIITYRDGKNTDRLITVVKESLNMIPSNC